MAVAMVVAMAAITGGEDEGCRRLLTGDRLRPRRLLSGSTLQDAVGDLIKGRAIPGSAFLNISTCISLTPLDPIYNFMDVPQSRRRGSGFPISQIWFNNAIIGTTPLHFSDAPRWLTGKFKFDEFTLGSTVNDFNPANLIYPFSFVYMAA